MAEAATVQLLGKIDTLLDTALRQKSALAETEAADTSAYDTMMAALAKICVSAHAAAVARGDHNSTRAILEKYLGLDQHHWQLRARLAESHLQLGNPAEAVRQFRRALEGQPDNASLCFGLGVALMQAGHKRDAVSAFESACRIDPGHIGAANNLANLLCETGAHDRARPIIEAALARQPSHPQLLWTMAMACQESGDLGAARTALRALLAVNPDHAEAYRLLGLQSRFDSGDPHLVHLQEARDRASPGSQQRVSLGFALFKAHDQLRDFNTAWRHLDEANKARFALSPFDIATTQRQLLQLQALYTTEFIERFKGTGCEDAAPVFIVGLPRSGTSLTEQILSSHPDVHGAGELDLLHSLNKTLLTPGWDTDPAFEGQIEPGQFGRIGAAYIDHLRGLSAGARVYTDKMPANFMLLGLIRLAMPRARIIHCRREPLANSFALYASYLPSRAQGYSFDLLQIAAYTSAYERLMAHWHALMGDAIHVLDHDALVADQEGETRRLLDFVGLAFDPACLDFHQSQRAVRTLSATQIRAGLQKGTNDRVFNYLEHLQPLILGLTEAGIGLPSRATQSC